MAAAFDAVALVAAPWTEPQLTSHNRKDCIMYALGIGSVDTRYCWEQHAAFAPYPWMPVVFTHKGADNDVVPFPSVSNAALRDTSAILGKNGGRATGVLAETWLRMTQPVPLEASMQVRFSSIFPPVYSTLEYSTPFPLYVPLFNSNLLYSALILLCFTQFPCSSAAE